MSKGRLMLLQECAKSNVKTEEMFKKHGFIEDSATKQHRLMLPDPPISAPRFTHLRTLAKLSPMNVETFL